MTMSYNFRMNSLEKRKLISFVLGITCLFGRLPIPVSASKKFSKVSDLRDAIYEEQRFFGGCYKLLNATGPVGCQAPSDQRVSGVLMRVQDLSSGGLDADRVMLCPVSGFEAFAQRVASDEALRQHVKAVLMYIDGIPASQSSAPRFPLSEYAPYADRAYPWNPYGSGLALQHFNLPMFRLDPNLYQDAEWRARYNNDNDFKGTLHWAEMDLRMFATQANSSACLTAGTCQPLGGFSVWAAMPPLPVNASGVNGSAAAAGGAARSGMPVTLVVAQLDANSMFHDSTQASGATLAGLVSMLGAMEVLRANGAGANYTRQLVFAVLAGESWGYMGSRRLLLEMSRGGNSSTGQLWTPGLDLEDVDQVIELGQLGRAYNATSNATTLYLHSQRPGSGYGDASALVTKFKQAAAVTTEGQVSALSPSPTTPGIPPSSLSAFLKAKPGLQGLVVQEFDTQFLNPYYHSEFDNATFVQLESMSHTAVVLARTLHALATGAAVGSSQLKVDMGNLTSFVNELAVCMMLDDPGMSCGTVTNYIVPDAYAVGSSVYYNLKHYIGVLNYIHPNTQHPELKFSVYRFLWNLMGNLTTSDNWVTGNLTECDFSTATCPAGTACIGWRERVRNRKASVLMGRCVRTTVHYVPAVSTKIGWAYDSYGSLYWQLDSSAAIWEGNASWPDDPMWTEANWPGEVPLLSVMQREQRSVLVAILIAGLLLCAATAVVCRIARAAFEKHLKSQ